MTQANWLLDSLPRDPAHRAKGTCGCAKRALGRVLCVLVSGEAQQMVGLRISGADLICGVACKAWADWQAGCKRDPGRLQQPRPQSDFDMDECFAERLLQAMVAAAKADGCLTPAKRRMLDTQLARLGIEPDAQALIAAEMDSAIDVNRIAGLARSQPEAVEIYTASLMVIDPKRATLNDYLAGLALRLGLADDLVAHVHARVTSA